MTKVGRQWSVVLLVTLLGGCSSPNRGIWRGTFDGSVAGTVEFTINARGTKLEGEMTGSTRERQPFKAELTGKIKGDHFYAEFRGASRFGALPVAFEGFMRGTLKEGLGNGDWEVELAVSKQELRGSWQVEQVDPE